MQSLFNFIKSKWWLFACFIIAFILVIHFEKGSPTEVIILFLVYSVADFCMILMANAWQINNVRQAGYFHLTACTIFTAIFLYQGLKHSEWHYAWVSIVFLLGAFKAFWQSSLKRKGGDWFNWQLGLAMQLAVLITLYFAHYGPASLINWFEAIGMAGFSIVLLVKQRDFDTPTGRRSNWLAIIAIGILVSSSFINAILQWKSGYLKGLPIALTLFAFCVWLEFFRGLIRQPCCKNSVT